MIEAKRKKITFPDSEKVAYINPISSSAVAVGLMQRYPRPKPPVQMVSIGDGSKRREVNFSDPDYKIAVREWTSFIDAETQQEALKQAISVPLSAVQVEEVEQWKTEHPGYDDAMDDISIWFWKIAVETDGDFTYLINAISGVNEEEVDAIQDSFQGDV